MHGLARRVMLAVIFMKPYRMRHIIELVIVVTLLAGCGQTTQTPSPTPAPLGITLRPPTPSPSPAMMPTDTPTPTATPAPTPTPIVYVVQPGDTLLGIALRYGVTVADLQQVNGILNPLALQIGQELIIPFAGPKSNTLLPTPTPLPVTVSGVEIYETSVGSLWALGEVVNSGAEALENVQVRVTLLDGAGQILAAGESFTALDIVLPKSKSPFGLLFMSPPGRYAGFQAVVVRAESSMEPGGRYAHLTVTEAHGGTDGWQFRVTGVVRNNDRRPATDVKVVVTTYDAQGQVTGYRQQALGGTLAAGAQAEFSISFAPNEGSPMSYSVAAEGRVVTE